MSQSSHDDNPLLQEWSLPPFDLIRPEHALPALEATLSEARTAVREARSLNQPGYDALVGPLELADERIDRVFSPVSHLNAVTSTAAWREVFQKGLALVTEFRTAVSQDEALFRQFRRLARSDEYQSLGRAKRKCVDDALRDFRLSGVHLPPEDKRRFRDIQQRLSRLGARFEENVLDATDAWFQDVTEETRLAGLPADVLERAEKAASDRGVEGLRLTLDLPTFVAVMHHARDRDLRRDFYRAWMTRASDQGPHDPKLDNGPLMEEILALRHEAARLTGFDNYATYSLATKMAPSVEAVDSFLQELADKAVPQARAERDEIQALARELGGPERLEAWDMAYYGERLKERRFGLRAENLRPYFPLERVLKGLFEVAERLFGIRIRPRDEVPAWHEDVRFYDVIDEAGDGLAGFYIDAYARPAKRSGAWMDVCTGRLNLHGRRQLPVAYLTLNASAPMDGRDALLTHDEVVTLFHEFGHGLHHMLTRVDVPSLAGIEGVEWDAVELPSQFLENWCWHRESLDRFARHHETGAPMPGELFDSLSRSRRHMAALTMVRQLEFALFDLRLHADYDPRQGSRIQETLAAARQQVAVVRHPEWSRFAHSFSHIFGDAYAAGYYSYLWAEVLAADAFSLFRQRGLFDADTGKAFRDQILAVGGSRPAIESFRAFRGRDPKIEPLLDQYGIAA